MTEVHCPHCNADQHMSQREYVDEVYADGNGSYSWAEECLECGKGFTVRIELWITMEVWPDDNTQHYSN